MLKNRYQLLGVMSGTSLDGLDLAQVFFQLENGRWIYEFGACETLPYSDEWRERLASAIVLSEEPLELLDKKYTTYLALQIQEFIDRHKLKDLDAIASHGHTVFHRPDEGITKQIGNRAELAKLLRQTVVCDFRVQDVALGGQGAPLVPIGDRLLFGEYDYCINLGGFANLSFEKQGERIAFDICPVNICLNPLAQKLGLAFDNQGAIARSGNLIPELLKELEDLPFYQEAPPKSLGLEWVRENIDPILVRYSNRTEDILHTFTEHIALQIANSLHEGARVLFTGGGSFNTYLIERIGQHQNILTQRASDRLINFKEALIFALLGVLKLRDEVNCLRSVTGASRDHSSGKIINM